MGLADFFRGKGGYQASDYLLTHPLSDKYFYRLLQFKKGEQDANFIWALDTKSPRLITFDPWPQQIFLNATGLKTIHQFTIEMARRYNGKVPKRLEQTIIEETEKLINENIIAVSDEKVYLSEKFLYAVRKK